MFKVKIRIDLVEPMGAESYVFFKISGQPFVAKFPPLELFKPGAEITVGVNPEDIHLFDPESEKRLVK